MRRDILPGNFRNLIGFEAMKSKCMRSGVILILLCTPLLATAQEASISLPPAYLNESYSQNIADILRDTYHVALRTSSLSSSFEWRALGPFPRGLGIDPASGTVFGTPAFAPAKPYVFRVQVLDRSLSNPAPLNLLVSLKVLRARPGEAPVLVPIGSKVESKGLVDRDLATERTTSVPMSRVALDTIEPLSIDGGENQGLRMNVGTDTETPDDNCSITEPTPDDPKDGFVVIDANTGRILEGSTRVSENTRVKVAFVNKNPFKYDYSFQLVPKDVGGATVISFLGLIPGIPAIPGFLSGTIQPATTAADKSGLAQAKSAADARGAGLRASGLNDPQAQKEDECATLANKVLVVVNNGEAISTALKAKTELLKTVGKEYATFLKTTDKTFDHGGATARTAFYKTLCEAAVKAKPKLQQVSDIDFDEFVKSLKLDLFEANVRVLEDAVKSSDCKDKILFEQVVQKLKADVTKYKTALEELKKAVGDAQKTYESPLKIINAALGSKSTAFAEAVYAPSLGDATSVSITILRKNLREENPKEETIAVSPPLEIGESRIVLSGGIGFSTINERKIIRQPSLVPNAAGAMVLGNRFGFENRSQFRPSGLIMINGILKRFDFFGVDKASFAISGGLVFSDRNDGLAAEFIAGPSLGFANNRMFLTLGFHAARVEELSGGFKIGDPVPDGLADPLPLQKNWRNGLMMGLTFKINPK